MTASYVKNSQKFIVDFRYKVGVEDPNYNAVELGAELLWDRGMGEHFDEEGEPREFADLDDQEMVDILDDYWMQNLFNLGKEQYRIKMLAPVGADAGDFADEFLTIEGDE